MNQNNFEGCRCDGNAATFIAFTNFAIACLGLVFLQSLGKKEE
jgi:hypothetical protein